MKTIIIILLVTITSSLTLFADENKSIYKNKDFSISPLYDDKDSTGSKPLMMKLKAVDGFMTNVNLIIQPYSKTIKNYSELTLGQFKDYKLKVLKSEFKENAWTFEYAGVMSNLNLHWYGKAVKSGNKVYLITGTAKETQWKTVSVKLIACVNSFKLNKTKEKK
ncbi:MAG: hypothetical protein COA79_07870 [Planctomycetota bacterium]|nr:MAG: hypothetical protein COA79_07870 [Planctomycetota bacterium]